MRFALVAAAVLLLPAFSGCTDLMDAINRPDFGVRATDPALPPAWNRDPRFHVVVDRPASGVAIAATLASADGRRLERSGVQDLTVEVPDGTWDVAYTIDGHKWKSFEGLQFDATPPGLAGLELLGNAPQGSYLLGKGATVTGASSVRVIDLRTGSTIATTLPVQLSGLTDGLQIYLVTARDEAGNIANETVQVRVGHAVDLPAGSFTFGVVARYSNAATVWDLSNPGAYATRAQAASQASGYLGDGFGVTPKDPAVKAVVDQVVTPDMNTMQAALALYRWFADNLEYDETRLSSDLLLTPREVLLDTEDGAGRDCEHPAATNPADPNCDGLVMEGSGNHVRGGICRDLAGTFVSLLRAAGIPARLVSGYVAGGVNGFHAWVEFYAGAVAGQDAWVPVDVSPIDGPFREATLVQAFAIRLPDYLPLRPLPPDAEKEGWSTAQSVKYTWPQNQPAPDVPFEKQVSDDSSISGYLCFNEKTRARLVSSDRNACGTSEYGFRIDPFVIRTQRTIDYGIQVNSASRGSKITAEIAYPFPDLVVPDLVDFQFYGKPFTTDKQAGKAIASFTV